MVFFTLALCSFLSCTRSEPAQSSSLINWSGAYPAAILQSGEHPLWFLLTEDGPVHITAVEDAAAIYALVPWPYALHIRFMNEKDGHIVMAVNRDGFLKLGPYKTGSHDLALYRFPAQAWQQYTVGGLVYFDDLPAAVIYHDRRFLISDTPSSWPRIWSFNMNSNIPFPADIPVLRQFPHEEGWDIDTLRLAENGFYYYRAARRNALQPEVRIYRTASLAQDGQEISVEMFYNSAPRENIISHPSLPRLPEGFVYTGTGRTANSLFASWEEQEDYSIGAAGFVVIKH